MKRYSLVGVDGNAFAIMGYTARAMKHAGMYDRISEMQQRATSGNYDNLICVCLEYIDMVNDILGLEDEEED